jgi:hypothetical protein
LSTIFCPEERFVDRVSTPPRPALSTLCRGSGREKRLAQLDAPHKGASLVKPPRSAAAAPSADPAGAGARSPAGRNAPAKEAAGGYGARARRPPTKASLLRVSHASLCLSAEQLPIPNLGVCGL